MDNEILENKASKQFILSVVVVVLAFAGGTFLGQSGILNAGSVRVSGNEINENLNVDYINTVLATIEQEYIEEVEDSSKLTYGAAKGIVNSLGDQYSVLFDPEEAQEYLQSTGSMYSGIGVQLGQNDIGNTVVVEPFEGSPGANAGLKAGDEILAVDGEDVVGFTPQRVAELIRGEEGTEVKLVINPGDGRAEQQGNPGGSLVVDITRAQIDLDNIDYEMIEEGVAKINIYRFTESAKSNSSGLVEFIKLWDEVVDQVKQEDPQAIVVDLRYNPGGFVSGVKYVAEEFLPTGDVIFQEKQKDQPARSFTDSRSGEFEDIPIVVIVNENSASAAEIFAAALKENERATIVGTSTTGKGVESTRRDFSDGSILMLVFRYWLTPDGNQITADSPLQPNIIVEQNLNSDLDEQLQVALEELDVN